MGKIKGGMMMSRSYDVYCGECKKESARSDWIEDNIELCQCLECGKIWIIKQIETVLDITGITQQAWKDAEKMVYRDYSERLNCFNMEEPPKD